MSARECDRCKRRWDFGTDWLGRVYSIHPIGPCVPIGGIARALSIGKQRPEMSERSRCCAECNEPYEPPAKYGRSKIGLCSPSCRLARHRRLYREHKQRSPDWYATKLARQTERLKRLRKAA